TTCLFSLLLFSLQYSFYQALSCCSQPVMGGQIVYHLMFQPVMQWQEDGCQQDHKQQVLPGFALSNRVDIFLKNEEDELKEHKKRKEPDHLNGRCRNTKHSHHYHDHKQCGNSYCDQQILDII